MNNSDIDKVRNAWQAIRSLQTADSLSQTGEALKRFTREMASDLLDVMIKLRAEVDRAAEKTVAVPPAKDSDSESDSESEDEEVHRQLRWKRKDRVFTNLMNLACMRAAKEEEARKVLGLIQTARTIPYGVEDSKTVRAKIRNYRSGLTGGKFSGSGDRYACDTVEFLCKFNPTNEELDEAAEYYRRNPE